MKKLLYYGIMIVALLAIIEGLSRAYYYQYLSPHPVAFIQVIKDARQKVSGTGAADTVEQRVRQAQMKVRPGFTQKESEDIVREQREANKAEYTPWVEFTFRDYRGKYLNVTDHIRRSIPDQSDTLAKQPLTIWFLGGSTTYGFGVSDSETLPSCFVRVYRQSHPNGRPIRVINRGMPFYYSYQELIQFTDLLFRDEKPDLVIMLDGLNDCLNTNNAYRRVPAFAIGKSDTYQPGSKVDEIKQVEAHPDLPPEVSADSAAAILCRRYLDNIRHAHDLATLYNIPLYCFWQPVPYYNYPNRQNDPICTQTVSPRFERIYPLIKTEGAPLPYFFFLGDLLQDQKGLPFIDQIHYSPEFSRTIAEKMLRLVSL